MPVSLEERVAFLEGKVEEHSKAWADLKDIMVHLEGRINGLDQKVDRFREELSSRIDALEQKLAGRIDATNSRIDVLEQKLAGRIDATNSRIDALDQRLSGRIDALDQKLSKYFLWIIGVQVAVFLAIIGVLLKV